MLLLERLRDASCAGCVCYFLDACAKNDAADDAAE